MGYKNHLTDREYRRFYVAQVLIGGLLAFFLAGLSIAIADHGTTPQFVRYIISPGYILGLKLMTGRNFFDELASFGRIAFSVNLIYFGSMTSLVLWKVNWPRLPKNPNHRFWMNR